MNIKLSTKQPGVTSLLVVLGIGLFMMVLVSGIAALSLREQQQARNTEFSNRALQTAEAGIKAAVQKLSEDPGYTKTDCPPGVDFEDVIPSNDLNQEITCIEVKSTFSTYQGQADIDKASQLIINAPAANLGMKSVQLRWHSKTLDPILASYVLPSTGQQSNLYPTSQNPPYQWAASPEITFIYWPIGNISAANNIKTATVFFTPGRDDQAHPEISTKCVGQSGATNTGDYRCVTNGDLPAGFDISSIVGVDPTQYNYAVRIKPRYTNMHFQFTAFDKDGKQMNLQSNKAQIDVTARTGDLYRRVKAEKLISPGVLESLFDSVLYAGAGANDTSARSICKKLVVRSNGAIAPTQTPQTCP